MTIRKEQDIFDELEHLSSKEGFIDVLSFLCWKDTFVHGRNGIIDEDAFANNFDRSKLCRTELATLYGLMCKTGVTGNGLTINEIVEYAQRVYELFEELHRSFYNAEDFEETTEKLESFKNLANGSSFMREAIFYSGESVFKHQYRDLVKIRYQKDNPWLKENKGFVIEDAISVLEVIDKLQLEKLNTLVPNIFQKDNQAPFSSAFCFSADELHRHSELSKEVTFNVLSALSASPTSGMNGFSSVDDFNHRNAFPIVKLDDGLYASFLSFSNWESLYESPFFWFNTDSSYKGTASDHRGEFTEDFTADRLRKVFPPQNVYTNIDIYDGKNRAGEIDVLVVHGKYAIVIQAKSKKLTIPARKGNSKQLKSDFKAAVQDAYDQSYLCAELLQRKDVKFKDAEGKVVALGDDYESIFPVCIVSDHYPALASQAQHFLRHTVTETIKHPYVMDVFLIDMMTEMLSSPLYFLDFVTKRSDHGDSIHSNHELTTLSCYIIQNLFFDENPDMVILDDDVSASLELSMLARREDGFDHIPKTPRGILTNYSGTLIGNILDDIKNSCDLGLMKLGFHILSLSEGSGNIINDAISQMVDLHKKDNKHHDATLPILEAKKGLTIHVNNDEDEVSGKRLVAHCEKRKYTCKADEWVGLCFSPVSSKFRFATYHCSKWEPSVKMDKIVESLPKISDAHEVKNGKVDFKAKQAVRKKIGRNSSCPCGSGKKFKRCCI
ncbi:nuclease-related domain-containing protein [Shewanella frigidimarina]|uniref:NERD domain protein n=1 Tax=Shewanella frigidimarina (strain NCIMB 400) TaxID=318167 RepID=Q07XL6_SHEFN|nr:nuclease-related domain-containing protein [Shewanella frigidimarina]ABI73248.1 NERD domain protein [Shewanella frigidimarina NCIMB 400]